MGGLRALKEDLANGYLFDLRTLVAAEVFTDLLDMAEHLVENGYQHPASSLTGAVLEDGMREMCRRHGVRVGKSDLQSLNSNWSARASTLASFKSACRSGSMSEATPTTETLTSTPRQTFETC